MVKIKRKKRSGSSAKPSQAELLGQMAALNRSQAVVEFDLDGIILGANENYLKMLGYTLDEVRGKHHRILVEPTQRDSAEYRVFWEKLALGEFQAGRQKRVAKDGHVVWMRASYNPIMDARGRPFKVIAFAADITETIRKSYDYEGQLRAVHKAQAVIEFALDGTIMTANDNFLKAVGYTLAEILGKHHSLFVDPAECGTPEYRRFWEKLGRGEYDAGEYKRIGKGGRPLWLQATYNPIMDMEGKPFKVVKYATDVTAQKHQNEMNAAFKGALDNLGSHVMVADGNFNIIYLNRSMQTMLAAAQDDLRTDLPNFDASRVLGANIDVFHRNPAHQRAMLSSLAKPFASQFVVGGRTLRISANPMLDAAGNRLGTVVEWADRTNELAVESEIKALVQSAGAGDLTRRMVLEGKSGVFAEIGKGVNQLTDNLSEVVSRVQAAASEVSRGAQEISQGNTDLSRRTEEQASSLEETASSMEEMTSTVKQNADNANKASQLATSARDQADKGGSVVAQAIRAMTEINEASKKIVDIIGVIDEIAFQTNLLALNAAVEAARAGEQGRGFAVVASEVRNLAGRSATAAKQIKSLIHDSVKKVEEGSLLVSESGQTLDHIVASVKKVSDIIGEIAAAGQEQSEGIDQVNKAVMRLDETTQQNAALVEEASAASQGMADQARALNELIDRYKVSEAATRAAMAAMKAASVSRDTEAAPRAAAAGHPPPPAGHAGRRGPASLDGRTANRSSPAPRVAVANGHDGDWKEF